MCKYILHKNEVNLKEHSNYFNNEMNNTDLKLTAFICKNCVLEVISAFSKVSLIKNVNIDTVNKFTNSFNVADLIKNIVFKFNLSITMKNIVK